MNSFFSILLSLVILMTTSGFSIYTHHCNYNRTSYYSLFTPSAKCNMHAPKPVVKSCCQPESVKNIPHCDTKAQDDDCCTDHSKHVKLDTQTVLNHTIPTMKVIEMQSMVMLVSIHQVTFNDFCTTILTKNKNEIPPPLSTTEYLSRIQVYLI